MQYNARYNNTILIGDTHSTNSTNQLLIGKIPSGHDVVHIGDGGWGFGHPDYALDNARSWGAMINKTCVDLNIILYHVIGNHDNPDVWKFDNYSNLIFVKTGDVLVFPNGKKALFIGGGISIDRCTRKLGYDYWPTEVTVKPDVIESCDYVFSHDAPEEFNHSSYTLPTYWKGFCQKDPHLLQDAIDQRKIVGDICACSGAKRIIGGHFHNNNSERVNGVEYRCLNIDELYDFKAE